MLTKTFPKTTDVTMRILLNDGLTPLNLSYLLYDLTNLYNIRLFSESLITRYVGSTNEFNKGAEVEKKLELIVNPKYTGIPNSIVDELNTYLDQNRDLLGEQDVHWTIDEFYEYYKFQLKRINYNSPGSLDLIGIGKIAEQIKDFLFKKKELDFEKKKYSDLIKKEEFEKRQRDRELEIEMEHKKEQLEEMKKENEHRAKMRELEYREKLADIQHKELEVTKTFLTLDNNYLANNEKLKKSIDGSAKRFLQMVNAQRIEDIKLVNDNEDDFLL